MRRIVVVLVVAALMVALMVAMALPSFTVPGHAAQGKHLSKAILTARDTTPTSPCGPPSTEERCKGQTIATVAKGGGVVVPE